MESSQTRKSGGTHSCRQLIQTGGDVIAVTHPVPKTGYKAPNAYGARPVLQGETTKDHYERSVQTVGRHKKQKDLQPYYPNAPRNRPKWTLENVPGRRFGVPPLPNPPERYRGESHISLRDGTLETKRNWKTTKQLYDETSFFEKERPGLYTNQGIFSDVAKTLHSYQRQ